MNYRREIDGLRALAIMPVLFFHFFPSVCPLGYLGVDLFFVISGYLITQILKTEWLEGKLSFRAFYARRIRRILPTALVVLLSTSIICLFLLISFDLLRYMNSLLSTLWFTANFYFWRTGGYFGSNDELKPLLHMWSLGIEEQFYLVFPVILFFIFKVAKSYRTQIIIIFSLIIASFSLNIYLLSLGLDNLTFFLLPTRVWEFFIGALFALIPKSAQTKPHHASMLALLGLLLIGINYFFPITVLPAATVLTIGAGLFLWKQLSDQSYIYQVLTSKPLVFIGIISFSLYLWHWPIIALVKYITVQSPPFSLQVLGLIFTFLLSCLSWKYIEKPFRKTIPFKQVIFFVLAGYGLLMFLIFFTHAHNGFSFRHSASINTLANAIGTNYQCPVESYRLYGGSRACVVGNTEQATYRIALAGNSHAQMYGPAYIKALDHVGEKGLIVPLNGCLPLTDINISPACLSLAQKNLKAIIADDQIQTVIIALTWVENTLINDSGEIIKDNDFLVRKKSLLKLLDTFEKSKKQAFLVGPIAVPHYDFPSVMSRKIAFSQTNSFQEFKISRNVFDNQYGAIIDALQKEIPDKLILPHTKLCDTQYCYFSTQKEVFFADSNHLSLAGALKTSDLFMNIIQK